MTIAEKLDDYGKPAWITVMVLSFIVFWPAGLAILAYLIWSGRMGCGKRGGAGRWQNTGANHGETRRGRCRWQRRHGSSGNLAFDEYRDETLRRLEDEQQEFLGFLDRLRHAKDKAEFDQFVAERDSQPRDSVGPDGPGDAAPQPQT